MKKKSGAARRLVSLVLALGLIFTLAPASVFAGDEVPVSSTAVTTVDEPSVEGTEPAVEGTEPAEEGTEPAEEGTEPAVEGTEPAVEGTEPAEEGTEPAVEGTEPAEEGTEPAVEGTEPAVEGTEPVEEEVPAQQAALVAASVPAVMKAGPQKGAGYFEETFRVVSCHEDLAIAAAYQYYDALKVKTESIWCGEEFGDIICDVHVRTNGVYYFVKAPNGMIPEIKFVAHGAEFIGEMHSLAETTDKAVPSEFLDTAKELGYNYTFYFNGHWITNEINRHDTVEITVTAKKADEKIQDAYFYLRRPDTLDETDVAPTDYYYIGNGTVSIPYELQLGYVVDDFETRQINEPTSPNPIIFNEDLSDLTKFKFDTEGKRAPGTYTIDSWQVIKCADGASWAYPEFDGPGYDIVESGTPTWHVDGTVSLNKPAAYFYAKVKGDTSDDYRYLGIGDVTFRAPKLGDSVNLKEIIPVLVAEKDILTRPTRFENINYNGLEYSYAPSGTDPYTYTIEWDEAVAASEVTDNDDNLIVESGPVWRVNGTITFHVPEPLPGNMQPTVTEVDTVYNGDMHEIKIGYEESALESRFEVTYQVKENEKDAKWSEPSGTVPGSDTVVDQYVMITFVDREKEFAPYVVGDKITGNPETDNSVRLKIAKRPVILTVSSATITEGQTVPKFTVTASGEDGNPNSGLLGTHKLLDDYKTTPASQTVGNNEVLLDLGSVHIVNADNNVPMNGNYTIKTVKGTLTINAKPVDPGPGPNPTPVPTPVPAPVPTPVTPVAPVTPDEEEEEPEDVEEIPEEETPQASPDTDVNKEDDKTENIEDEETAQAGAPGEGNWALLNLILMVLTVVAGLGMLALRFVRKTGVAHLIGIVPAIVALVAFFVTEDMSLPMAMTDKWTLIMAVIALVQLALLLLGRNGAQDDEQPREQY